jgi:hypothetical protein
MTSGTRLGPYEILAPPGAGGMGEVYKPSDTRLDRTVAIKVSKTECRAALPVLRLSSSETALQVSPDTEHRPFLKPRAFVLTHLADD